MKTITSIFKINILTYVFIFVCLFSGRFKTIILYLLLIILHELGHLLIAILFNWKIDKVCIYPLGGIIIFNDLVNKPVYEEFLVTIMGPIFQIIAALYLKRFDNSIILFSNSLLFFNLLPIIPLDGGKLFNILLFLFKPIKKSIYYSIILSYTFYIFLLILVFNFHSLFFLLVIILLLFKIYDESKKLKYYHDKYLIEKYLYIIRYRNNKYVKSIDNIFKYRNNYILINNKIYSEKEYINEIISKNNCK